MTNGYLRTKALREKVGTGFSQKAMRQQTEIEQDAIQIYRILLETMTRSCRPQLIFGR